MANRLHAEHGPPNVRRKSAITHILYQYFLIIQTELIRTLISKGVIYSFRDVFYIECVSVCILYVLLFPILHLMSDGNIGISTDIPNSM